MERIKKIWFGNTIILIISFGTLVMLFQNAIMIGDKIWVGLLTMCALGCGMILPIWFKQTLELEESEKVNYDNNGSE